MIMRNMSGGFIETGFTENQSMKFDQDEFEPDNKVLARIVDSFRKNGKVKKTQLQLASKLRWDLFVKYWDWLNHQQYIKCVDLTEKNEFVVTSRGNELFTLFINYSEFLHQNDELVVIKP